MTEESRWLTTSGLPLDGARVVITDAEFGFNAQIGAGVTCFNATFTVVDDDTEIEQSFSVGTQGEPSRDGTELVNAPRKFPSRSNFGRLLDSAVNLLGTPEACDEIIGDPAIATNWIGTEWTMGTVTVESTNPTTKEKKSKDAFVFVEFHGVSENEDEPAPAKAAASKKAAPTKAGAAKKAAPAKAAAKKAAAPAVDPDSWAELVALAGEYDDHDAFMEAAFEREDVEGDKALQKAVYQTGAGSVWAEAHG